MKALFIKADVVDLPEPGVQAEFTSDACNVLVPFADEIADAAILSTLLELVGDGLALEAGLDQRAASLRDLFPKAFE